MLVSIFLISVIILCYYDEPWTIWISNVANCRETGYSVNARKIINITRWKFMARYFSYEILALLQRSSSFSMSWNLAFALFNIFKARWVGPQYSVESGVTGQTFYRGAMHNNRHSWAFDVELPPLGYYSDRTCCNINFRATVYANRARNFSLDKVMDGMPKTVRGPLLNFTWLTVNRLFREVFEPFDMLQDYRNSTKLICSLQN